MKTNKKYKIYFFFFLNLNPFIFYLPFQQYAIFEETSIYI
jgi:hypothetical protein